MAAAKHSNSSMDLLFSQVRHFAKIGRQKAAWIGRKLCAAVNQFVRRLLLPVFRAVIGFFGRSPRAFAGLVAMVLLVFCTATVAFATDATTAYSVMYNGQSLGAVSSTAVLAEAEILAAGKLNNTACAEQLIETTLTKTVVASEELMSAEALADQMISHSDAIVTATVLSVDGKQVAADRQTGPVNAALDRYLKDYKAANSLQSVELCASVAVNEVYTLKSSYEALPSVADYLADNATAVPVQTVNTVVETETIAYETIKTESSAYTVGTEIVTQQGKAGVAEVTYKVATTNGAISEKTKISTTVVQEPVARKITVGTKRVIAADKNGDAPMVWPVKRVARSYVSSYVGDGRGHKGMDIAAPSGTPIYATAAGTVTYSGRDGSGYGNYIIIRHADGVETLYAHCKTLYVKAGDTVAAGESIAAVGNTGRSTGNHLHFEVHKNGVFVNPSNYIGSN